MRISYIKAPDITLPSQLLEHSIAHEYNLPRFVLGPEGKKLLFVTDRVVKEADDWRGYKPAGIFHEEHEKVIGSILRHVMKIIPDDQLVKEAVYINYPSFYAEDKALYARNKYLFAIRLTKLIKSYTPDCVIFCGVPAYVEFVQQTTTETRRRYIKGHFGRIWQWKHKDGHIECPMVGTISIHQMASQQADEMATYPNLIGIHIEHILTAIRGTNKYNIDVANSKFIYVNTIAKFDKFYSKLLEAPIAAIDTETKSLARTTNELYSIQFAFDGKKAYFIPMWHPKTPFIDKELGYIRTKLKHYFEYGSPAAKYHIYHNANFDLTVLKIPVKSLGVRHYQVAAVDGMGGAFALEENRKLLSKAGINEKGQGPYSLDFLTTQYGCQIYYDIKFSKSDRGNMATTRLNYDLIAYACYDVLVVFQMFAFMRQEAKEYGQTQFMPLMMYQFDHMLKAFSTAEYNGVLMDKKHLKYLMGSDSPIKLQLAAVEADMKGVPEYQEANDLMLRAKNISTGEGLFNKKPWYFSVKKALHKACLFFDVLGITPLSMNKGGTSGKIDKKLQEAHKDVHAVALFTLHQKLSTLLNTFIGDAKKGLYGISIKDPDTRKDGRLRPRFDFKDVVTGRTCLEGATPILVLDDRGYVPIKDIKAGDWVWSFNKELKPVATQVEWSGMTSIKKTVTVTYQPVYGEFKTITCSPCHRFRMRDGSYVVAGDLNPGDRMLGLQHKYSHYGYKYLLYTGMRAKSLLEFDGNCHVVKVTSNNESIELYDLTIPEHHNFVANGVCVHNSARAPNLQNISQHDRLSKYLKRLFIASPGCLLLDADLVAHEVRCWANISKDHDLANAFRAAMRIKTLFRISPSTSRKKAVEDKGDIHKLNHKHFYGRLPNNKAERNRIKAVVFGVVYGAAALALSITFRMAKAAELRASIKKLEEMIAEIERA